MEWLYAVAGIAVGAGVVLGISRYRKKRAAESGVVHIADLCESFFGTNGAMGVVITERVFPRRMQADLQQALDSYFADANVWYFAGVNQDFAHTDLKVANCFTRIEHNRILATAPSYDEVDVGNEVPVRCLSSGVWFFTEHELPCLALVTPALAHGMTKTGVLIQLAVWNQPNTPDVSAKFFDQLEAAIRNSGTYRGRILSLELDEHSYTGQAAGVKVHQLHAVTREQVVLPAKTLNLLERNVVQFVQQRPGLAKLGLPTRKGLLFYGPPGTGKTHTIHYLIGALPGHTTFLMTAEQMGLLKEYMTLARLLQPSIVVLEDVDLIARDRTQQKNSCSEPLLNQLLNEMDGLRPNADILFMLTTNRPETLEPALADRPGRVDQAIEFPVPDDEGRTKLILLYAAALTISAEIVQDVVRRTAGVSAAFLKELMRRTAQINLQRNGEGQVTSEDINEALDELLVSGGRLNRNLLGATLIEGSSQ